MAIHTKMLNVATDDIFDEIISFFEDYWDDITVEADEEDDTKLYFKEDTDKRAMLVYDDNKINFTIYGSSEDVYKSTNLPYGSSGSATTINLTATSKGISLTVNSLGELIFGKSRDEVNFVCLAYRNIASGVANPEYYIATSDTNNISMSTRVYLTNNISYTWLINVPVGINEGLVDYADGVYIPINYQIIGNTFPYIFRTNLMVNTLFSTLDDGQYTG